MTELLAGNVEQVHNDAYVTLLYHYGRAYLRQGKWKLVTLEPPFREADFELFNIEADPRETTNLAEAEPEKYQELLQLWKEKRKAYGIWVPADF